MPQILPFRVYEESVILHFEYFTPFFLNKTNVVFVVITFWFMYKDKNL